MNDHDNNIETHEKFMRSAIAEAKKAEKNGDVPIGAVIVKDDIVISTGFNRVEIDGNSLHHAEMTVINEAIKKTNYKHLLDCRIYVTLEPCPMCAGAIILSRIPVLCFGAYDPKAGASGSLYSITSDARLNHRCQIISGVLADECSSLLSDFFKHIRKKKVQNDK